MKLQGIGGKVVLIAGGGKIFTDIAARFVRSERSLEDIVASPYEKKIVQNILESGHDAALEFDFFLFGVEGYSRVTEVQLVRKRHASFLIKSGRAELGAKREFSLVMPHCVRHFTTPILVGKDKSIQVEMSGEDVAEVTEQWYNAAIDAGMHDEDARYLKPQATEFKGIIGMNAHGLRDFLRRRMCFRAQREIRHMASQMCDLARNVAPDLMVNAGPSCISLGFCTEGKSQCKQKRGCVPTQLDVQALIENHWVPQTFDTETQSFKD